MTPLVQLVPQRDALMQALRTLPRGSLAHLQARAQLQQTLPSLEVRYGR